MADSNSIVYCCGWHAGLTTHWQSQEGYVHEGYVYAYAFGDNSLGQLSSDRIMGVQTKGRDPKQWIVKDEEEQI